MVQLHIKQGEESLFLYETLANTSLAEIIPIVAKLQNDRRRLERLVTALEDLLQYGPSKSVQEQGYTEEQLDELAKNNGEPSKLNKKPLQMNGFTFYETTCPIGMRVGLAAGDEAQGVVRATLKEAQKIISKEFVKSGVLLTPNMLLSIFETIKGALTIVYPQGLPEWDPVREAIEDTEQLEGTQASKQYFAPNEASLWWAGKELLREKQLSEFIGKNEKTKIIVKIQKKGSGPPVREPHLSEEEQKNMMAYYYRKQEQLKKLEENDEDDYLHSSWANPKALKNHFTGIGNVKWGFK